MARNGGNREHRPPDAVAYLERLSRRGGRASATGPQAWRRVHRIMDQGREVRSRDVAGNGTAEAP